MKFFSLTINLILLNLTFSCKSLDSNMAAIQKNTERSMVRGTNRVISGKIDKKAREMNK